MDTKPKVNMKELREAVEDSIFTVPDPFPTTPAYGKTITETFMDEVNRVRADANAWQEWAINEILYLRDKVADLEGELL